MNVQTANLERNLPLLKWLRVDETTLAAAVVIAYEMHVVGLSLTQVLIGEAIFALVILLWEIPSGVFSDLVSRKFSLLFAEFFLIIGVLIFAFAQNFTHIIIAQITWAIAVATLSGTESAMLYDTLKGLGREKEHKKVLGKILAFGLITIAIGQVLSGFIGHINLRLTLLLCIPIPIAKFIMILFFVEPPRETGVHHKKSLSHTFASTKWIMGHRTVLLLIIATMVFSLGRKMSFQTFNPYMELVETPIFYWGIMLASFNLIGAFIAKHSHKWQEKIGEIMTFSIIFGLQILGFLLMAHTFLPLAFLFPAVTYLVFPFKETFFSDELNKRTETNRRATVLSMASFCTQGLQMLALPFLGYIADLYSLQTMYMIMAAALLVVGTSTGIGLRKIFHIQ